MRPTQVEIIEVLPIKQWLTIDQILEILEEKYGVKWGPNGVTKLLRKAAKGGWYHLRKKHRKDEFMAFDNNSDYYNHFGEYLKTGLTVKVP